MIICDWKRRWPNTQRYVRHVRSSLDISSTTIGPKVKLIMVRVVITKVALTWPLSLFKNNPLNVTKPHLRLACNNFKVINMDTNVVIVILLISWLHSNIAIISRWFKPERAYEVSQQRPGSFSTYGQAIKSLNN